MDGTVSRFKRPPNSNQWINITIDFVQQINKGGYSMRLPYIHWRCTEMLIYVGGARRDFCPDLGVLIIWSMDHGFHASLKSYLLIDISQVNRYIWYSDIPLKLLRSWTIMVLYIRNIKHVIWYNPWNISLLLFTWLFQKEHSRISALEGRWSFCVLYQLCRLARNEPNVASFGKYARTFQYCCYYIPATRHETQLLTSSG